MKFPSGITARTTQLAWTITLVTMLVFVVFIIPEQLLTLRQGMAEKAKDVTVALHSDIADSSTSANYSAVIQHAKDMVAGDPELEFVVIARADGYAIVVDRGGGRTVPRIDGSWLPAVHKARGHIQKVPLFHARVFQYSDPMSNNGLPWGWIHVGLKLERYESSVRAVYLRTGMLAVLCLTLALLASILFAQRFVRPILSLRAAVERVAGGDLAARAEVDSQDEIEQLALAFNNMADAVLHRDRIVEAVRYTAQSLQARDDWQTVMEVTAAKLGQAANVSRVILVENRVIDGDVYPHIHVEWCAPGIGGYGNAWANHTAASLNLAGRMQALSEGQLLTERSADFLARPIPGAEPQPQSSVVAPIIVGNVWGVLVIHDCWCNREWLEVEHNSVRAITDTLSAFFLRERAQKELLLTKSELELHVLERTRELSEQILARDRAHAELQEAQQQFMELSRQSGMAEVATGVLHNVGNVFNSINVSANLVSDRLRVSRVVQVRGLAGLLKEHEDGLADFLLHDERGQRVLPYMCSLSEHLVQERDAMSSEMQILLDHVSHVKDIISVQQSSARSYGVMENLLPESLVNEALRIVFTGFQRQGVELTRKVDPVPALTTDRHKVLQILLNLLRNAMDAVKAGGRIPRSIAIRLSQPDAEHIRFAVTDNGVGIAPENLDRIFSHGFTTKKDGHGFGLHSGALAADLLGGSLRVQSDGIGLGASFMLDLPLQPNSGTPREIA